MKDISIYCEDASHPGRVAVIVFSFRSHFASPDMRRRRAREAERAGLPPNPNSLRDGTWVEKPPGTRPRTTRSQRILNDEPAPKRLSDYPPDMTLREAGVLERDRWRLICRKCKGRPRVIRAERLQDALDAIAAAGASEASLSALDAILAEQSTSSRRSSGEED